MAKFLALYAWNALNISPIRQERVSPWRSGLSAGSPT